MVMDLPFATKTPAPVAALQRVMLPPLMVKLPSSKKTPPPLPLASQRVMLPPVIVRLPFLTCTPPPLCVDEQLRIVPPSIIMETLFPFKRTPAP